MSHSHGMRTCSTVLRSAYPFRKTGTTFPGYAPRRPTMMYGHRARIGYTVAAVTTEGFPIDWYKIVPDGVTLMMITLPLGDRSADDVTKCFDISIEAAHTFAASGANL